MADLETIKTSNRAKILRLLMDEKRLTQQEISKKTGMSIPTVTNNVNSLLKEGIVAKTGVSVSTGGRRPAVLSFLPDSKYSFGIDISPKKVRIILSNLDSKILAASAFNTTDCRSMDEIINHIHQHMGKILSEKHIHRNKILGVGISLYGTVNEEKMILEMAPNLKISSENTDFNRYENILGFPLFVENDANVSALAEFSLRENKSRKNLIFVVIETGIGCGILINGQLYKGQNKRAGEFGHMAIASLGKRCSCGGKDCWELYASERALIREYNAFTEKKMTRIDKILSLVEDNDPQALIIWEQYLDYLSLGIKNIILIHDPQCIVLGGRLSRYEHLLLEPLTNRIFKENRFYNKSDVTIATATLKEDASIIGASLLPLQKVLFRSRSVL